MESQKFLRHGDRNLRRIDTIGLHDIPRDANNTKSNIIGIGESNHRHRIKGQACVYVLEKPKEYQVDGRTIQVDQFLEVLEPCTIQHEEHKEILIQPAKYALVPEREVDIFEQKIRMVMD